MGAFYGGLEFAYITGDDPSTTDKNEAGVPGGQAWDPFLMFGNYWYTKHHGAMGNPNVVGPATGPNTPPVNWYLARIETNDDVEALCRLEGQSEPRSRCPVRLPEGLKKPDQWESQRAQFVVTPTVRIRHLCNLQDLQQPELHSRLRLLLDRRLLQGHRQQQQHRRQLPGHERPEPHVLSGRDRKLTVQKTPGGVNPPGFSFLRR